MCELPRNFMHRSHNHITKSVATLKRSPTFSIYVNRKLNLFWKQFLIHIDELLNQTDLEKEKETNREIEIFHRKIINGLNKTFGK